MNDINRNRLLHNKRDATRKVILRRADCCKTRYATRRYEQTDTQHDRSDIKKSRLLQNGHRYQSSDINNSRLLQNEKYDNREVCLIGV